MFIIGGHQWKLQSGGEVTLNLKYKDASVTELFLIWFSSAKQPKKNKWGMKKKKRKRNTQWRSCLQWFTPFLIRSDCSGADAFISSFIGFLQTESRRQITFTSQDLFQQQQPVWAHRQIERERALNTENTFIQQNFHTYTQCPQINKHVKLQNKCLV